MSNGKGFGAIVAAGIVGTIAWALTKYAQEQEPVIVYEQKPNDSTSTKANLLQAVFGAVSEFANDGSTNAFGVELGGILGGSSTPATTTRNRTLLPTSSNGSAQPLLDMIARYEGGVNGYNVVYNGSRISPPKPITTMTVQEVRNWQDQSVSAGSASSAVGKYQIIRRTLDRIINSGTLRRGELFDADAQERAGRHLLEQRGYTRFKNGSLSESRFAKGLAQEWASLPVLVDMQGHTRRVRAGQSYYAGDGLNTAHYTPDQLISAIRRA